MLVSASILFNAFSPRILSLKTREKHIPALLTNVLPEYPIRFYGPLKGFLLIILARPQLPPRPPLRKIELKAMRRIPTPSLLKFVRDALHLLVYTVYIYM